MKTPINWSRRNRLLVDRLIRQHRLGIVTPAIRNQLDAVLKELAGRTMTITA